MRNLKVLEPEKLVLIGSSTGGPGHIQKIVESLPPDFSATLIIAQHLAKEFVPSFVNQLKIPGTLDVMAVSNNILVLPAKIYVCTLDSRLIYASNSIRFSQLPEETGRYNPDIDSLFESAARLSDRYKIMGIILTGIGDDGVNGCRHLSEAGGVCIAESESSAIVYGMPFQASQNIRNISVQNLDEIIQTINNFGC